MNEHLLDRIAAEVDEECGPVLRELNAPDLQVLAEADRRSPYRPDPDEIIAKMRENGLRDPAQESQDDAP